MDSTFSENAVGFLKKLLSQSSCYCKSDIIQPDFNGLGCSFISQLNKIISRGGNAVYGLPLEGELGIVDLRVFKSCYFCHRASSF